MSKTMEARIQNHFSELTDPRRREVTYPLTTKASRTFSTSTWKTTSLAYKSVGIRQNKTDMDATRSVIIYFARHRKICRIVLVGRT